MIGREMCMLKSHTGLSCALLFLPVMFKPSISDLRPALRRLTHVFMAYGVYVMCLRILLPTFHDNVGLAIVTILAFVTLYGLAFVSHLRCMLTNPGESCGIAFISMQCWLDAVAFCTAVRVPSACCPSCYFCARLANAPFFRTPNSEVK